MDSFILCSQRDVRTIEGELFKALVAAGAVSKDNADDPVKVSSSLSPLSYYLGMSIDVRR